MMEGYYTMYEASVKSGNIALRRHPEGGAGNCRRLFAKSLALLGKIADNRD
jgi:hypothetical protein